MKLDEIIKAASKSIANLAGGLPERDYDANQLTIDLDSGTCTLAKAGTVTTVTHGEVWCVE